MAISSDTLRFSLAEETTSGTAPTGAYDLIRTTGEGLQYEVTTSPSEEMGGLNRGVKDNILQSGTVNGDISWELSKFVSWEEMISASMGNDWGDDPFSGYPGIGANVVFDHSTQRTFTLEKRFGDGVGQAYTYHQFVGCQIDTATISMTPNEAITGSFGFIGQEMTTPASEAGSTYNAAGDAPVMTAPLVTGIELLSPAGMDNTDGTPLGTVPAWMTNSCFTGLDLNVNNNLRGIQCIGELGLSDTSFGRFEVSATGTLYYYADEPLDALVSQEEFGLRVTCTDENGGSYQFFFPRVVFSSATALATGTNTDVMTEFSLQMLEWQGDDYAVTMQLTRDGAAT